MKVKRLVKLSLHDLQRIELALRLQWEAYRDSGQRAEARKWRATHLEVLTLITLVRGLIPGYYKEV